MQKKVFVIYLFYRGFAVFSLLLTGVFVFLLFKLGIAAFFPIFWAKVMLNVIGSFFYFEYKSTELPFYYNFGVSKEVLFLACNTFDVMIFIFLIIILI